MAWTSTVDTALYYTFSTIAQTLAAAIALLAAFALYRLQGLLNTIEITSLELANGFQGEDLLALLSTRLDGDFIEFERLMSEPPKYATSIHAEPLVSRRRTFSAALRQASSIRRWLNYSLAVSAAVILGAIIVLTRVPTIAISPSGNLVLCGGIVGTGVCLIAYYGLIRKAL